MFLGNSLKSNIGQILRQPQYHISPKILQNEFRFGNRKILFLHFLQFFLLYMYDELKVMPVFEKTIIFKDCETSFWGFQITL
jgi:hypothetical protein